MPCHCSVSGCPFVATLPRLRDHLVVDHSWPLDTLPAYGNPFPLYVPASDLQYHCLVVVDRDKHSLFTLSVHLCSQLHRLDIVC